MLNCPHLTRRGFSLVEAVVSILIVGLMLVAAMHTVGAARFGQWKTAGHARAEQLGMDLLEQVNSQSDFDGVDNYHGLTDTIGDFQREVTITRVRLDAPSQAGPTDAVVKRLTVTVRQSGAVLAEVHLLKTKVGNDG